MHCNKSTKTALTASSVPNTARWFTCTRRRRRGVEGAILADSRVNGIIRRVKGHDLRLNLHPLFCQRKHSCLGHSNSNFGMSRVCDCPWTSTG